MKHLKLLPAVVLIAALLTSCEEKDFDVVVNLIFSHSYTVHSDADVSEEYSITKGDIDGELEEPEDATLDSIYITSLYATIKTLPGNTASQVVLNGEARYTALYNGTFFPLFNDNTVDLPAVGDSIQIGIQNMVSVGIKDLKYIYNNLVLDPTVSDDEEVTVRVQSNPIPAGSNVHAEITVYVEGSAVYEYKAKLLSEVPESENITSKKKLL